jgi:hypothetical protein
MATPLVVVLGAGASRGAADFWLDNLIPPLTVDLFDEGFYGTLLERYDLAHQAGRYVESKRAADNALSLERVLHGLRESQYEHHRRMAYAVPPYLQHLLHAVSEAQYSRAFRYDRIIERLLCLPYVCFLSLNYDVLLDRRLAAHHQLNDFEDYISEDKNWSLIKLHGSVNWFYRLPHSQATPPTQEPLVSDEEMKCRSPFSPLENLRGNGHDRYPALALPEGPDDHLVLPSRHHWFVEQRIENMHQFDLLVLGYSGIDSQVLELLAKRKSDIRRLTIVDKDQAAAFAVYERFLDAGVKAIWPYVFPGNFGKWVDGDGLDKLVEEYDGPYSDWTE